MNSYIPSPLSLDHIEISAELKPLIGQMAEQVHETWAKSRYDQGWTYGEHRDDVLKLHPDMKPFSELSAEEAAYDVDTATCTIKLLLALGWTLVPPSGQK